MSSRILLTFENSEVNLSSGTEAEAAAYQLSWGERSVLKGQVKGLAVLYLVCAVDWRIQTLQIAKGGFVAVTENDRSTEHREKEKPLVTERFKKNSVTVKHLADFMSFLSSLWEEGTVCIFTAF